LEDLQAMIVQQNKKIEELASQLSSLRDAHSRTEGKAASLESLKQIVDDIQEVDKKRIADNKLIREELTKIAKVVAETPAPARTTRTKPDSETRTTPPPEREPANGGVPQNGYEYPVEKGDTLSTIAAKYRTQGIKVSVDDILKANPGLRPEKLSVGQKLFIPQPKG
jgi:LysM repeat protein